MMAGKDSLGRRRLPRTRGVCVVGGVEVIFKVLISECVKFPGMHQSGKKNPPPSARFCRDSCRLFRPPGRQGAPENRERARTTWTTAKIGTEEFLAEPGTTCVYKKVARPDGTEAELDLRIFSPSGHGRDCRPTPGGRLFPQRRLVWRECRPVLTLTADTLHCAVW